MMGITLFERYGFKISLIFMEEIHTGTIYLISWYNYNQTVSQFKRFVKMRKNLDRQVSQKDVSSLYPEVPMKFWKRGNQSITLKLKSLVFPKYIFCKWSNLLSLVVYCCWCVHVQIQIAFKPSPRSMQASQKNMSLH